MRKCLILITAGFPFGDAEPFLEPELPFLCNAFAKTVILSLDAGSAKTPSRPVPDGVEFFNVTSKSKKISRLSDWIRCPAGCFHKTPAFNGDAQFIGNSIKKRLFLEYFEARANRHLKEILPIIGKIDFSGFGEIVIYSYWFFVTARVGALLKDYFKNIKVSFVSRGHGYDIYSYANPLGYLPGRHGLLRSVDRLYVCSQYGQKYLQREYPEFKDKISFSYLGTDDCGINPSSSDTFHIVTCSRAVPLKRIERVVSSLELLCNSKIPLKWTHIGSGKELSRIKKLADSKLAFMKVDFLGSLQNTEVLDFYRTVPVSLFVNVSRTEGLPVSIIEACSFGIPTVATDVGGTKEVVCDCKTGFLISSDFTDKQLSDKIAEVASMSPDTYSLLCTNARKLWEDNFSSSANYKKFIDEISSL